MFFERGITTSASGSASRVSGDERRDPGHFGRVRTHEKQAFETPGDRHQGHLVCHDRPGPERPELGRALRKEKIKGCTII